MSQAKFLLVKTRKTWSELRLLHHNSLETQLILDWYKIKLKFLLIFLNKWVNKNNWT